MTGKRHDEPNRGKVALILAFSAAVGILMLTAAALFDALTDPENSGISSAYAALITTTLGVTIGGLVGYIGGTQVPSKPEDSALPLAQPEESTPIADMMTTDTDDAWVDEPPPDAAEYKE